MTDELTPTASPDFVATLTEVIASIRDRNGNRPSAEAVVNALLQAEKAAKKQRLVFPLKSLFGNWRLCFIAPRNAHLRNGVVLGKGFYVPRIVPAQISFGARTPISQASLSKVEISNSLQFGSLLLKLTGPAKYLGKKNLLAFDFTHVQLSLFGRAIYSGGFRGSKSGAVNFYEQSIAKLPFFAFFLISESFIAARGRGGGLALWVKLS
ncbi:MAG TPA: hypothetical protein DEV81_13420 [Cyanobacteria bacterium UBA11049]|nr:hypothetical protein [Cyanobacteria bacterium UBA11049]